MQFVGICWITRTVHIALVQKIIVEVRNDQILKVTVLKFKLRVSFEVGSNQRLFRGGSNFIKIVPDVERMLSQFNSLGVEH